MPIIFSSGCYAPYIYTIGNSSTFSVFPCLRSSVLSQRLALLSSIAESRSAVARDVDYPVPADSVSYNGACKCFAREIEVIMRVRVRLCGNACVSRRMRESWQLCIHAQQTGQSPSSTQVTGCSVIKFWGPHEIGAPPAPFYR